MSMRASIIVVWFISVLYQVDGAPVGEGAIIFRLYSGFRIGFVRKVSFCDRLLSWTLRAASIKKLIILATELH